MRNHDLILAEGKLLIHLEDKNYLYLILQNTVIPLTIK